MAKTINFNPAVQVSGTSLTVTVDITEGGHTIHPQFAFDALDFDCNYSASNPYVAKFIFDPNDITQILDVQGDFTTVQFDGVTKVSAFALAELVVADIGQYNTGGGGGSYTFPTNHGNTAYVATGGNDGTGTVGNISKPFETLQAAIDALDGSSAGQVIILSSSSFGQQITSYDANTNPYVMVIRNLTDSPIEWTGTGDRFVGQFTIETSANVQFNITGGGTFNVDDYMNINCRSFLIPGTHACDINHSGVIKCDVISINANSNNPALSFGIIDWRVAITINEPISYQKCNPMKWVGVIAADPSSAPVAAYIGENTLGETLSFTRSTAGIYGIQSGGGLFNEKTFIKFSSAENNGASFKIVYSYQKDSPSLITFQTYDTVNFALDDYVGATTGTHVEILIYP